MTIPSRLRNLISDRLPRSRTGSVIVLSAALMVAILAFTAFTVDLGYIALTRTQLQAAADGSALAASLELIYGYGPTASSSSYVQSVGSGAAQAVASVHKNGDLDSTYLDPLRDVRFGTLTWNGESHNWKETWGATPYNIVQVNLFRGRAKSFDSWVDGSGSNRELPLLFGPVIGHSSATVAVTAKAAMLPVVGIRIPPGETAPVLPIAVDEVTWNRLIYEGIGVDNYAYSTDTESVSNGPDSTLEMNLFPGDDSSLPSGNRGTVDFGNANNSTTDLERQILNGLSHEDMSYYPKNEISLADGYVELSGDTGIDANLEGELKAIIGELRIIPVFRTVVNPGTNATYTIVKWVGVRVMDVSLRGKDWYVNVQPASFVAFNTIRVSDGSSMPDIQEDTVFAPVFLYE